MISLEYLRQFRIAGFAIFDFSVSFLGMALLAPLLSSLLEKRGIRVPKKNWVILTLPISVVVHLLFGSMTPFTNYALDPHGHYFIKFILVACCLLGITNIKRVKVTPS